MRATRGVIGRSLHARQYKKNSVVITESSLLRLLDLPELPLGRVDGTGADAGWVEFEMELPATPAFADHHAVPGGE